MEKIIILGKGGHARSVVDAIEREGKYEIAGYVVNDKALERELDKYSVIGSDKNLAELYNRGIHYAAIGVGYLGKGILRRQLYNKLKKNGFFLPVICDPSAVVSTNTKIDEGTFIGKGAIVNSGAIIGAACIINSGAIIEHDSQVGSFSHISVGTILCGEVVVGEDVFIGANSTVIQGRRIGNQSIIGAGEVIKKNILG